MVVFVVPVYGRWEIASVCLRQLARTCEQLPAATAVVVGNEDRFGRLAAELGFGWRCSPNEPLGRKWNDGYQYAGEVLNADYIVPVGSDDVVHPGLFEDLPATDEIVCTRHSAIVSPDGERIAMLNISYPGGDGVRVFPRVLMERLLFRPCLDHKPRAIDGSITTNLSLSGSPPRFQYRDTHPLAIIDFKTRARDQRNSFMSCLTFAESERSDVFAAVAEWHGEEFASEVMAVYRQPVRA